MSGDKDPKIAMFELYLATAEKVGDRRAQANSWMLSVNSAIVAFYGYLQADKVAVGAAQKAVWLWAIPAAGAIICLAWTALLTSCQIQPSEVRHTCRARSGYTHFPVHPCVMEKAQKLMAENPGKYTLPGDFKVIYAKHPELVAMDKAAHFGKVAKAMG